jgi:hypothetical protein
VENEDNQSHNSAVQSPRKGNLKEFKLKSDDQDQKYVDTDKCQSSQCIRNSLYCVKHNLIPQMQRIISLSISACQNKLMSPMNVFDGKAPKKQQELKSSNIHVSHGLTDFRARQQISSLSPPLKLSDDNINLFLNHFQLFGYDFIVDSDFNCQLLEINATPATSQKLLSKLAQDTIEIVMAYGNSSSPDSSVKPCNHIDITSKTRSIHDNGDKSVDVCKVAQHVTSNWFEKINI